MRPNRLRSAAFVSLALALLVATTAAASLEVCGAIDVPTTWTFADSPVRVTCDLVILPGAPLTLEPHVRVHVQPGFGIEVRDHLDARGEPGAFVSFDTEGSSPWTGIRLVGGSATIAHGEIVRAEVGIDLGGGGDPTSIDHVLFADNGVAIAGAPEAEARISGCRFFANGHAIEGSNKLIVDCEFLGNDVGLHEVESTRVHDSSFTDHQTGITAVDGVVKGCRFESNLVGVSAHLGSSPAIVKNTFTGNGVAVVLGQADRPFEFNNLVDNDLAVRVDGAVDLDGRRNWWGTTGPASIQAMIRDGRDDVSLGVLAVEPTLEAEVPPSAADLSLALRGPEAIFVGAAARFEAEVVNHGPDQATEVAVFLALEDGLTFLPQLSDPRCRALGRTFYRCDLDPLGHAERGVTWVSAGGGHLGVQTASAEVEAAEPDPVPEDNEAEFEFLVETSHVGGALDAAIPAQVVCTNLRTGQAVIFKDRAPAWDCEAAGLLVLPGDPIFMSLYATAR